MKRWLINLFIIAGLSFMGYSCGQSGQDQGSTTHREQEQTGQEMEDYEKGTSSYDTSSGAEFSTDLGDEGEMDTDPTVEDGYTSEEDTTSSTSQDSEMDNM